MQIKFNPKGRDSMNRLTFFFRPLPTQRGL
nr:MAG TPA: hypothetical protein [Caudoviricetes sp.]